MKIEQQIANEIKECIDRYNELKKKAKEFGLDVELSKDKGYSGSEETGRYQVHVYQRSTVEL